MTSNAFTRAGFGLLFALLLGAGFAPGAHAASYLKSYSVVAHPSVRVLAANGSVRVTTSDSDRVEFIVTYDRGIVAADLPIDSRQTGNVVELRALMREHSSWWDWSVFTGSNLTIEVRMPRSADLRVDTSNGAVSLDAISGNVQVHTSNAAIDARGLDGRCVLTTSNGLVTASGRFQSLDIWSTNAAVRAHAQPGSRMETGWSVRTTNGGVELSVPADLQANLTAGTTNGGIMLRLPVALQGEQRGPHLRGTLGGGGPELFVRTTNAGVRLDPS